MENQPFTFGDYLNLLANKAKGETANKVLSEIENLRTHKANINTMHHHLKQYRTLKSLCESGIELF
jgi:hypothetical protein